MTWTIYLFILLITLFRFQSCGAVDSSAPHEDNRSGESIPAQSFANQTTVAQKGVKPWKQVGQYGLGIKESSGIVASRQFEGVYWTHGDSGNPAVLYATTLEGKSIRHFPVRGASNQDWEDLAIDDKGRLWVGDIGNNNRHRTELNIYVVPEPNPFIKTEAHVVARYSYRYPDGNRDAEGLFLVNGLPHIIAKELRQAVVYRFTDLDLDGTHTVERIGTCVDARFVTGADLASDGKRLAVCSYDVVWVYQMETSNDITRLIHTRPWALVHDIGGEGVGFDGDNLVLTNEKGTIFRLPQSVVQFDTKTSVGATGTLDIIWNVMKVLR